jgi:NAD(P)-dependent dehydrogenase (short-subunit alcohol dehydrogenase family)
MDLGLNGRVAVITGASRGIGRATATELAREGMRLAICARDAAALERAARELRAAGADVLAMPLDVQSLEGIQAFVQRTEETYGRIDLLVNNAGPGSVSGEFLEMSDEAWVTALNVRVLGYVRMARAVAPIMVRQGKGRIVNLGGVRGKEPDAPSIMTGVVASAVTNFTRGLSRTLSPHGVTVVGVAPGRTYNERHAAYIAGLAAEQGVTVEEAMRPLVQHIPLRRFTHPEDLAHAITFLASDLAEAINGTMVMVDCGELRGL